MRTTEHCQRCGATWAQDWYDPPCCPRCGDMTDEELEEMLAERDEAAIRQYEDSRCD